jgi:tRNA threonylcarbamoyladenosine biosynthesis protein TsaB
MLLLAIETSARGSDVAVVRGEAVLAERRSEAPNVAAYLLDEVEQALAAAGATLRDLGGVACGLGPGAFTGLRVGLATAKGLAYALGLPLCGVPSLEALALRAAPQAGGRILAPVVDARRGEVYAAAYGPDLSPRLEECVRTPEALAQILGALPGAVVAFGEGALQFEAILGVPVLGDPDLALPGAREVGVLAARRWDRAVSGAALWALAPVYVRPSDAELNPRFRGESG